MNDWITIAPIWMQDYDFGKINKSKFPIDLGNDVKIIVIPDWLLQSGIPQEYSSWQITRLAQSEWAFAVEYKAKTLGDPDSLLKDKSKQEAALEKISLANLASWIARPTSLAFRDYYHIQNPGHDNIIREGGSIAFFRPHKKYENEYYQENNFEEISQINRAILKSRKLNASIWNAIASLIAALTTHSWSVRYTLFWIALESLFGIDSEISYRIATRISFFIGESLKEKKNIYDNMKEAYGLRCTIVHGRHSKREDSDKKLYNTEIAIQKSLKKILSDADFIDKFNEKDEARNKFLDNLIFSSKE